MSGENGSHMPEISVTDEQFERLSQLQGTLATTQAGPYASVSLSDTVEYLLDLSDTVDEDVLVTTDSSPEETRSVASTEGTSDTESTDDEDDSDDTQEATEMFNLLDTHGDKWRVSDGQEPYEVDLPDGSVEFARTRDDIKAVLFQNY